MPGWLLAVNSTGNWALFQKTPTPWISPYSYDKTHLTIYHAGLAEPLIPGISTDLDRIFDNFMLTTEVNSRRMHVYQEGNGGTAVPKRNPQGLRW